MKKMFATARMRLCMLGLLLLGTVVQLNAQRDPYKWPFASNSIWNMPIHNNAVYTTVNIPAPTGYGVTADEDIIILKPTAPTTAINTNTAGWSGADRCPATGANLMNVPIPGNFIYSSSTWLGNTPNAGVAVLMPDGVTIKNTQPFARCTANGAASSQYNYPDNNLNTDGIQGAHGGSGMSVIGGSIRLGELMPGSVIRHVLKMNIDKHFLFYNAATEGYRWPALKADGYAPTGYTGTNIALRMGSLLAIDKTIDVNALGLTTEPAKIIARALQNYGAYIVDDPNWDVIAFGVEHSPDGKVVTEFQNQYGYSFESPVGTAWSTDIATILQNLKVVDNNTETNLGGGPTTDLTNRRAAIACSIGTAGSGATCPVTNIPVIGVTVTPSTASLTINGTKQLSVSLTPTNATNTNVTWTTNNSTVATVNSSGLVTGKAAGTATITATTQDGGFPQTCVVTVSSVVSGNYKIMPLGDSKTEGSGGSGHHSWRGYLRAKLMLDGNAIDYVGPQSNAANGDGVPNDNNHAGFGGFTIGPDIQTFCSGCPTTGLYEHVQEYFVAQNPDVVLLAAGVNDFFNAANHPANYTTTAAQRYQDLVDKILQLKPSVTLVLGSVEPVRWNQNWGGDPLDNDLGALNARIKAIADASSTDKIYFADIRNQFLPTWNTTDYYDDVHLSQQGATKVADIWYNTLVPILSGSVPPPVVVTNVSVSPTSASVYVGATTTLTATVFPSNATNKTVTWSTSNSSVATVSATGVVTGVAVGSATITVTTQDGAETATSSISVSTNPNLLLTNPSFESQTGNSFSNGAYTGITGWDLFNSAYNSIGVSAGSAQEGTNKLDLNYGGRASTLPANYATVTAGQNYTLSMAIAKVANTNTTIQSPIFFRIDWYNSSNVLLSSSSSGNILGGATSAWSVYSVTANAPANAAKAASYIELVNTAYPNQDVAKFTVDNVILSPNAAVVAVTDVSVSPTSASVAVGATTNLTATVAPSNATNTTVSWTSSNTSVATVNSSGVVTGVAAGSATITVTTQDGSITATSAITVTSGGGGGSGTNLLSTNPSFESQTGLSYTNGAYTGITGWSLNNTAYNAIGVSAGSAQHGNNKLELNFGGRAETIAANRAIVTVGQSYTLSLAIAKIANTNTAVQSPIYFKINWYRSNGNLLGTTTSSGNILGGGTSGWNTYSVTGTAPANAVRAGCYIELVNPAYPNNDIAKFHVDNAILSSNIPVTNVTMNPTSASIAVAGTTQLSATITPSNATNQTITWSSSNTGVATVSATGLVTGVSAGSATITVTTQSANKTASSAITVTSGGGGGGSNLFSSNPSFESQTGVGYANGAFTGITGWALNNGAYNSIGVTAGSAQNGNNKLELNFAGTAATLQANYATVTAGQAYTLSMAIAKVANTNTAIQSPIFYRIDWYNASNTLLSSSSSGNILGGATSAWAVNSLTATAPTNATKAACYIELVNTAYPNQDIAKFNIDNVKLNSGTTVLSIVSANAVSADQSISDRVSVYPNPVTNQKIKINTSGLSGINFLEISNATGSLLFSKVLSQGNFHEIDLQQLKAKGLLTVTIINGRNRIAKKILVQ